jgi:NitT/TauT family transport system permease protein
VARTVVEETLEERGLGIAAGARRRRYLAVVVGWAGFLVLWYLVSEFLLNSVRLPQPQRVAREAWNIIRGVDGAFFPEFWASIVRVFAGFIAAALIGTPLGFLMGRSEYWRNFFQAPVVVAGSVPGITYAVMSLVIFGISFFGPVLAVGLISMPYVALNVSQGVAGVDRQLVAMSVAYGRSERQIFRNVLLPSVLPFIFAGVRLSFSLAWKVGQLTEVFGASRGIGFQIRRNFQLFRMAELLAWVFLFIAFMLVLERQVLVRIERRLFRWRQWDTP